ncbi:Phosphatidylglycerophosphatase GEP4-like protein [Elsinoe fawcettii]|nr:Phosphatidylglycerophosphatase GEP4-like protein [Elsinoe fawcettii]
MSLNLSGTLNIFRLLLNPSLCLPHATVPRFSDLPSPISKAFQDAEKVDIRAVVLDKDNCFAVPHQNDVFEDSKVDHFFTPYLTGSLKRSSPRHEALDTTLYAATHQLQDRFQRLRQEFPGKRLLIVSNSAGTLADPIGKDAELLEENTGVAVLRHRTKKPGCGHEIQQFFQRDPSLNITSPSQIAVIGDRLFTDAMLANTIGARAIWIRDGVVEDHSFFVKAEKSLSSFLTKHGYSAPIPRSIFEGQ